MSDSPSIQSSGQDKPLSDNAVQQAFSRASAQYDSITHFHRDIGKKLLRQLGGASDPRHVIDIGMGTGWLTSHMTNLFPSARIMGLDFAPGMVREARRRTGSFDVVQADAMALPYAEGTFDLAVSNVAYQWVDDLFAGFREAARVLKPGGMLAISYFGYETLTELFTSLAATSPTPQRTLDIQRLAGRQMLTRALEFNRFADVQVHKDIIRLHFEDMWSLVRWLKGIGANRLSRNIFVGRDWMKAANDYYQEHFASDGNVTATFEILWARGKKI